MNTGVEQTSIRRRLQRTAWLAVFLGYGVMLVVNVQLFKQQRNHRQLVTMQRVERELRSNVALAGQPLELQSLFGSFSSSNLALWGHFAGQQSADVALTHPSVDLRQKAEQLAQNQSRPQLFRNRKSIYMLTSGVVSLNGNSFRFYLLDNVSAEVAFQRQLNALLLLVAALAALVSFFVQRRGIDRVLQPLRQLEETLELFPSKRLQGQAIDLNQLPRELKPLAVAVNQLRDRLADSFKRQQQFASEMSHELRNSITVIAGYNRRLLRRAENLTEDQHRQLLIVEEEVQRLGQLVTNLVAISRAESRHQPIDCEPLCIADLFQQSINLVEGSMQQRIVVMAHEGIDLQAIHGLADRASVLQCLVQLIDNACKYSPEASTVEISCSLDAQMVCLRVRDHGPGIPADEREAVFERFRRGRNSAGIPGSGLGLSLVQTFADQMDGSVRIDDAEGGGVVVVLGLRRSGSLESNPLHH